MANSLMFEVGVRDANDSIGALQKQLQEITTKYGKLELKVQVDGLERFIEGLKMIGSGKPIEELQKRFDVLQVTLANAGMTGAKSMQEFEAAMKVASATADSYRKRIEEMTATRDKFSRDSKGWVGANALLQNFQNDKQVLAIFAQEEVAIKNLADAKERLAKTSDGTEKTKQDVNAVRGDVDALVTSINNFVTALKSIGQSNGLKDVDTAMKDVDKNTQKAAEKLATTFKNLSDEKNKTVQSETNLATETQKATGQLVAEEEQAKRTALAMQEAAVAINNAALAARSLAITMGGNSQDVNKFIELSSKMDVINKQANELLTNKNIPFGEKQGLMAGYKQELEAITKEMDTLKSEAATTNPLIETFSAAFKTLSAALTSASESIGSAASNLKNLETNLEKVTNKTQNAQVKDTKAAAEASKQLSQATEKVAQANQQQAQTVQTLSQTLLQLGQKYNFTAEQAQKLAEIVNNGSLTKAGVQRGLGIGHNKASDIVETINAVQKLKQEESKPVPQGGVLDPQKFAALHDAIEKIISEINRLRTAFEGIGEIKGITKLTESINGIYHNVESLKTILSSLGGALKFKGNEAEIEAYNKRIDELKNNISSLETKLKNLKTATEQAEAGIKTVASGKGSEAIQNTNLDTVKAQMDKVSKALQAMEAEYKRMEEAGAQNAGLQSRIEVLRQYYDWLQKVVQMDLSKAGSLKATDLMFNGNLLFGQVNKQMYSDKAVKEFGKIVDETIKAKGAADSLNEAFERMKQKMLGIGTSAEGGMRGVATQMESINRVGEANIQTLIREKGHIERLIAMAEQSVKVAKGNPVAGMFGLENQQRENLVYLKNVKEMIDHILTNRNAPEWMRFLNTPNSLRLPLSGSDNDIALLGAHFNILTHNVTGTTTAIRNLRNEMRLDDNFATFKQWNTTNLERGLYNVNDAIRNVMKAWRDAKEYADEGMMKSVAQEINRLNAIKSNILSAMTNDDLLRTRNGYASVITPSTNHELKEAKELVSQLNAVKRDGVKADKEYNKEVERFTEQSKKAYAQAEKEKEKAAKERASAVAAAEKQVQTEITKTESLQKKVEQSITRGEAAKRDMSGLYAQNAALEQQVRLMEALKNSINRGNVDPNSDIIGRRIKDTQVLREDTELLRKAEEKLNQVREQANKRNDNAAIKQLQDEEKSIKQAWNRYEELKQKISEVEALRSRAQELKMDTTSINQAISDLRILKAIMRDIIDNGGKTTLSYGRAGAGLLEKDFWETQGKSTNMLANKNIAAFNKELSETERQSTKADANIRKLGMAFNELKGYMKANGGSEEMRKLQAEIQGAIQKMRQLMNAGNFAGAVNVYERMTGSLRQAATATKEFENSQHSLSSTISHTNSNLQGQSQILSDLKTMAMQYVSVWGAQSFIHNIIDLGGQLEQQRLSIGAILQDTAQANHLFSQIKDLAIKSPFGVQQLDAMTKQLSAYGFQYSELYEWTKRLADISAATGTSVDRLALALGHVRSEGALSGYTLRQFSMGNIPLLQKLSENLGKTKQEIRKMTRNKEIGYEDVLEVLKQLTDESGMFYQAQETMSQALNAKFKNLKDSFQIMYSEMAEGAPGDFLKGFATTLTDLSRQWQILLPMVGSAGAMWAMNKASAALVNVELAKMATLTNANTLASSKYSVAQLRQIANWEKMPHAMVRARLALQGFRTSLLSLGKMVFSWPTAIFAAIEALTYMWAKQSRESEKAKEMTEVLTNTALESQKNLVKQLSNIDPYEEGMSDSAMKTGIESMTEAIKNYGVNAQSVLETVFGKDAEGRVMSLAEKYQYLREELEKTEKVYKEMQRTSGGIEFGVEFTDGGWLDDDVQTDLTNYAEAVKEYEDAFVSMTANYSTAVNNALEQVRKASPEFKRIADGLSSDAERVKWLYENQGEYRGLYNMFKGALHREDPSAGGGVLGTQLGDNLRSAEQEAMKELDQFLKGTEEWFKKFGYDFTENGKNLSEVQVGNLLRQSKEWLEKHPEWQNIYDVIWDKLNKRWGLPIVPDVTEIEEELPQWLADLQKELDKTGIKLTANMSMEQIVDEMKKAWDKAQTTINKLGPIALRAKIDIKGLTDEYIEKYKFLNPELYETLKELKKAQESQSQVDAAGKKRGLNFKGMKKDGTHKAEKQNQEAAKAVREQVRVIKEAADAFQYWRDKVGDKAAWEHVQSEFGDILAKIGITADNIEDVRGRLREIPKMKEYKAIKDKKVKTEIDKEIAKEEDQYKRKDFERETEKFLSETEIKLDSLTRAWEKFNTVREATGNVQLAINIAGVKYQEGQRNLADAVRQSVEDDFKKFGVEAIPFSVELDKESIKRQIQEAFAAVAPIKPVQGKDESAEDFKQRIDAYNAALATHEARIKGVVTEYEKWQELQKQIEQADLQVYANLTGSAVDLTTELQKINDEYLKQLDSLNRLKSKGVIKQDQYNQSRSILDANTNMKLVQAKESYKLLVDGVITMNKNAASIIKNEYADALEQQLKAGAITAKDYADKIDEINKKMNDLENSPSNFKSFMEGGLSGLIQNLSNRGKSMTEQGASLFQQGFSEKDEKGMSNFKKMFQGQDMMKMGKNMSAMSQGMSSTANTIGIIIKALDDFAKGLRETFETMRELAESAGSDTHTSSWNTWDTMTSGFSRTTGNISKAWNGIQSGDIGAVLSGAVGTFVSPLIEYNKGHDRLLSYRIEDLTKEVKVIESDLAMIKRFRERNLGYDTGEARKLMSEFSKHFASYTKKENLEGDVATYYYGVLPYNMANYYNYDEKMNGYMQELEDLRSKRDKIAQQYSNELDKKNSSDEALREYQDQISELDEQIMYFTQDLSKELWDIDFKSWATQFSDALWTAFENGEDAAQAFHDTAEDIIADVAKRMMTLSILEPMFNRLQKELFGEYDADLNRYVGGKIKYDTNGNIDMEGSQQDVLSVLGKYFGEGGEAEKSAEAANMFYDWVKEITGFELNGSDSSSSSMSNTIKGVTEQTADLIASYLNACRADLSVNRAMIAQYFPMFYQALTSQNGSLVNIENHTAAIMRSNDAIERSNQAILDSINGLKNKAWKVPIA